MSPEWEDYKKLVYHWVNAYHRKCPAADLADLEAEGRLAFMETIDTWNPEKGRFSTHLVWKLRWFLSRWIKRETNYWRRYKTDIEDVAEERGFLDELLDALKTEAQEMVHLILKGKNIPLKKGVRKYTKEIRLALRSLSST